MCLPTFFIFNSHIFNVITNYQYVHIINNNKMFPNMLYLLLVIIKKYELNVLNPRKSKNCNYL
jgi:hypothetical protein